MSEPARTELVVDNIEGIGALLHQLGWLAPAESLIALESAGEGNMNRTLRAVLDDRTLILKQSVPFVARFPHIEAPEERLDVEAAFYRAVTISPALAMQIPNCLGYDPAHHLLCLEDLGPALDYSSLYDHNQLPRDVPGVLLCAWLNELHQINVDDLPDVDVFGNHAMRALNHAHIFSIPLDPDNGLELDPSRRELQAALTGDRLLRDRAAELGAIYLGQASHTSTSVLLHGDFYPGSWLRAGASAGEIKIIDPEFAFVGPPEFDIGVFTAHMTLIGANSTHFRDMFRAYSPPAGFDQQLAAGFAGMEIIRRLLGVAQLPLVVDAGTVEAWLAGARAQVLA